MHVDRIRTVTVPLHLVSPLATSQGIHSERVATLVEVTLDDGTVGWGEDVAPAGDFYTGESASTSLRAIADVLAPELTARSWDHPGEIDAGWKTRAFPMARCALESSVWDAWTRARGISMASALGVAAHSVRVNAVIGLHDSPASAAAEAMARVDEGYHSLKIKIAPNRDREYVAAIRDAVGDAIEIGVDANGAYGGNDIDHLASLADLGVTVVEQPFAVDAMSSSARLVATGAVRVGLDEAAMTIDDVRVALDHGALTALNVKPARVGGVTAAQKMIDVARDASLDVWVGGMLESGIGRAMALCVAGLDGVTMPSDLSASARYFERDLCEPFVLRDGRLEIPLGPGIGRWPSVLADGEMPPGVTIETICERRV